MKLTLFDLDGTLLPTDSDHAFGDFMVRIGWADGDHFRARNDEFFRHYLAGTLDIHDYVDFATRAWRHRPPAEVEAMRERFMREEMARQLHDTARALVRSHLDAGDRVAIVTATNDFVTRPIADAFGVHELIATTLARDAHGRVTGAIEGTPSFREGKIVRVHEWLAARGERWTDFEVITVYSDSTNDLPLMEAATHPVATNPSASLEAVAHARGWRILRLFTQ